jgi:hypothetical protein
MRVPRTAGPSRQDGFLSPSFDSSLFSVLQIIPRTLQIWHMQNPPPANKLSVRPGGKFDRQTGERWGSSLPSCGSSPLWWLLSVQDLEV